MLRFTLLASCTRFLANSEINTVQPSTALKLSHTPPLYSDGFINGGRVGNLENSALRTTNAHNIDRHQVCGQMLGLSCRALAFEAASSSLIYNCPSDFL